MKNLLFFFFVLFGVKVNSQSTMVHCKNLFEGVSLNGLLGISGDFSIFSPEQNRLFTLGKSMMVGPQLTIKNSYYSIMYGLGNNSIIFIGGVYVNHLDAQIFFTNDLETERISFGWEIKRRFIISELVEVAPFLEFTTFPLERRMIVSLGFVTTFRYVLKE